jgi:alpha-tubulin suppressor-like RCC1 family protein
MEPNHEILLVTKTYWGGFFPLLYQKQNGIFLENFVREDATSEKSPDDERGISDYFCPLITQFSVELNYQQDVMELSCGVAHLLLSTRSQSVMAMGYNSYNQLGVSCSDILVANKLMNITSTMIQEPLEIQTVTAGPYQSFIVFKKKLNSVSMAQNIQTTIVFSFGKNNVGQLGHGECSEHSLAPRQVFLVSKRTRLLSVIQNHLLR